MTFRARRFCLKEIYFFLIFVTDAVAMDLWEKSKKMSSNEATGSAPITALIDANEIGGTPILTAYQGVNFL